MLNIFRRSRLTRTFNPSITSVNTFYDKDGKPPKTYKPMRLDDTDFDPAKRFVKLFKDDFRAAVDRDFRKARELPFNFDITIIGGGAIGSSIAFWLKHRCPDSFTVGVIEKDPTYSKSATALSVGGIRQQFSLKENIEMSLFGAEFLRNIERYLKIPGVEMPDIQFHPHGYLFLATEAGAEQMLTNFKLQTELGAKIQLMTPVQLKSKFPWINTEGVALATHGIQNEGWFDPWSLLVALRQKAGSMGVKYMNAEVVGFTFKEHDIPVHGFPGDKYCTTTQLILRHPDGVETKLDFGKLVVAAGCQSGHIGELLKMGTGPGILRCPLPVEPRKRYVYCFHCDKGPGLDFPLMIDPSGAYARKEGMVGYYIGGMSPEEEQEPDPSDPNVDYKFFDEVVWPKLAKRVPAFECLKVKSAWAGWYDYNYFDQNAIVGYHPWFRNILFATGFSGHGIQMSPAVGRAAMELLLDNEFIHIDLSRFGFNRIIDEEPIMEAYII